MPENKKRKNPIIQGILGVGLGLLLIAVFGSSDDKDDASPPETASTVVQAESLEQQRLSAAAASKRAEDKELHLAEEDAECRKNIDCWTTRNELAAADACTKAIEAKAQYQAEWQDGLFGGKFSSARWAARDHGHLTFIGDSVKFQNGYGAWQKMSYQCDYNPDTGKVLEVRVKETN